MSHDGTSTNSDGSDSDNNPLDFNLGEEKFEEKQRTIEKILSQQCPDIEVKLKELAISKGGLVSDRLRAEAWPIMLGIREMTNPPAPDEYELRSHSEYEQVVMDVNRSLKRFPPGIPLEQRLAMQNQLTRLILRVIMTHPHLRYYQGYHDVAVTLLLVAGENAAYFLLENLSKNHLRDCMAPTMEQTSYFLNYIPILINYENSKLFDYLEKCDLGTIYALPWFLTWFSHNLPLYKDVVRLYDFFLASPPLTPLYLSAVLVLHRSEEIFNTPCDMAYLHQLLSNIPINLPFEELICKACRLYDTYPPQKVEKEVIKRREEEKRRRLAAKRKNNAWHVPRWMPYWLLMGRHRQLNRILIFAVAFGIYAYYFQAVEGRDVFL